MPNAPIGFAPMSAAREISRDSGGHAKKANGRIGVFRPDDRRLFPANPRRSSASASTQKAAVTFVAGAELVAASRYI